MFLDKIIAEKKKEIKTIHNILRNYSESSLTKYSLLNSLSKPSNGKIHIIAEIKCNSPSKGIIRKNINIEQLAVAYKAGGASAISIITDKKYFNGSYTYITKVKNIVKLPILAKDFIIHPVQLELLKKAGADAVLLIMKIMDDNLYRQLYQKANELDLDVLVEVHSKEEIQRALELPIKMIGINRRNLSTLSVDKRITKNLIAYLPNSLIKVAESGIDNSNEIIMLKNIGYDACLIGTSLVKSYKPEKKLQKLLLKMKLEINNAY